MDQSPRLKLPLIAAGQAQKHVTHNEALLALEVAVALHLEEIGRQMPPSAPASGQSYGVGRTPGGLWSGRTGQVAVFDGYSWSFTTPSKGWIATVGAATRLHAHDGEDWRPLDGLDRLALDKLGVGTSADAANPVALSAASILMTAPAGDGSIRVKINRGIEAATGSLLFQTAFDGKAEIGLHAGEGFGIKIRIQDGSWRQAMTCSPATARPAFPQGVDGVCGSPSLLINGDFRLNRRGATAGAAAANAFVADRWRAAAGGAVWSTTPSGFRLVSGAVEQSIEASFFGIDLPAGTVLDCTVEGLSEGAATVTVQQQSAVLSVDAPRRSFTLGQPAGALLKLRLSGSGGALTLRRIRLHVRMPALGEAIRGSCEEEALAERYFFATLPSSSAPGRPATAAPGAPCTASGSYYAHVDFPQRMVRQPSVTIYNPSTGAAGSWITGGGTAVTPVIDGSDRRVAIYGGGAEAGTLVFGHLAADAEPPP